MESHRTVRTVKPQGLQPLLTGGQCWSSHRRAGRGSVLLEAALTVTFLLVPVFLGIVQFGIFYNTTNQLSEIVREGGRYAALYGDLAPSPGNPMTDDSYIVQQVQNSAVSHGFNAADFNASTVTVTPDRASRAKFGSVMVTIAYDLNQKSLFPLYKPGTATRTATFMLQN